MFAQLLQETPDIAVVGTATHSAAALVLLQQQQPDVLILDLLLPTPSGLAIARAVLTQHPATAVLLVTDPGSAWDPRSLLALGLRGYLTTTVSLDDLRAAVRAVAAGHAVIHAEASVVAMGTEHYLLTPRERAVLGLLAQGQGNEEMAVALHLSRRTIERCLGELRTKLAARSSREMLHKAAGCGLLDPALGGLPSPMGAQPP